MHTAVVTVNGEPITRNELEGAVARYIIQIEEEEDNNFEPNDNNLKYLKTEALNHLIEQTLLFQLAKKENTEVSHEAVKNAIETMKENFETIDDWKNNLLALHIPEENLFDALNKDMIIEKFLEGHYIKKVRFTEEELKDYYDKNERFMKEPDLYTFYEVYAKDIADVKTTAEILQSGGFEQLEKAFKQKGSELLHHSDIPAMNLPEELFAVLADMEPGKIGTMPAPDGGMLVYKLINKTKGSKLVYDDIKEKLAEYLIQSAKNEIIDKLVEESREKAEIVYLDTTLLEK